MTAYFSGGMVLKFMREKKQLLRLRKELYRNRIYTYATVLKTYLARIIFLVNETLRSAPDLT